MSILHRYFATQVFVVVAMVLFLLCALFTLFEWLRQLADGDVASALIYVGLRVPKLIYELFPIAMPVGTVLALGLAWRSGELLILRNAGVSRWRVWRIVVTGAAPLLMLAWVNSEWIMPPALELLEQYRLGDAGHIRELRLRHGQADLYVGHLSAQGRFKRLILYEYDESGATTRVLRAGGGWYIDGSFRTHMAQREFLHADAILRETVPAWSLQVSFPHVRAARRQDFPEGMASDDLRDYLEHLALARAHSPRHLQALWARYLHVPVLFLMLLPGVALICGPLRRRGVLSQTALAALAAIGYLMLSRTLQHAGLLSGVSGPALAGLFAPVLLLGVAGYVMLARSS